ncbi:uncharacterized protein LOC127834774 [Dreissena polymorpha]|uniref:uncharacterized protein LOC127834773 n=1 Tax=Dreissena polymorpha TaxID=45954 RepID=UPI002264EBE3|nr:uncharacterized protein LOC127834773 [Dreissena polymorpha]XP_052216765.1 uncharacterized protein LOC127834774 [Dreissena polymorpha]
MKSCDPRNWNSRQRMIGGAVAVVVALVIIIPVAVTQSKKDCDDPPSSQSYQEICSVEESTMTSRISVRCDYGNASNVDPKIRATLQTSGVDVTNTSIAVNDIPLTGVTCSFPSDNVIICEGSLMKCSYTGSLSVYIKTGGGEMVYASKMNISPG